MSERPKSTQFIWPLRVYWEDTDAGGVIYHARYVAFMERARSEWLRAMGVDQIALKEQQGLGFIVRSMTLDYLAPGQLDDELEVSVDVQSHKRASMVFAQSVKRASNSKLLCQASVRAACISFASMRPVAMPDELLARM